MILILTGLNLDLKSIGITDEHLNIFVGNFLFNNFGVLRSLIF